MSLRKVFKTYATINIADLPLIDFSQVGETNESTIRKSLDGTEFVIKYQAIALMATLEWTPSNPLGE